MPVIDVPFSYRVAALAVFALSAVLWDVHRSGRSGSRWREYLFLFLGGVVGATLGVGNDLLTSAISPEYFSIGKGINSGEHFRRDVLQLGLQAGFSAGVILAAVMLFANSVGRSVPPLPIARVAWRVVCPCGGAMLGAGVLGSLAVLIDSRTLLDSLSDLMTDGQLRCFAIAWAIHIGLYAGAVIGLIVAVVQIRSGRRLSAQSIRHAERVG